VPGRELDGVVMAMDYLIEQNRVVAGLLPAPAPHLDASGRRVVILGGGDTGSDCYGTALRQGATHVRQIQLWPAPPTERAADNPWPEWPLVFRTSSSQEEGGERDFAIMTRRLIGQGGRVSALEAVRIDMVKGPDGRKRPVERPDGGLTIPTDLVILAIGFAGPDLGAAAAELGLHLDQRGNVAVDASFATGADGVYCAGDAMRGASLIVWAIADGRKAARAIDRYLARA
jgi:glutamate synthase (NADPH) small chain